MRGENQVIALFNVAMKLRNHCIGMACTRNNRMAIVTKHMSVNSVDFRYFNIKRFCGLLDYKINATDVHSTFIEYIGNLMNRSIENLSESICKVGNQRFTATVFRIVLCVLCRIFRSFRQESSARTVISDEHTLDLNIVQIFRKFFNVVEETRGLDNNGFAVFLNDKYFVADEIIGLVGVQLNCTEIVNIHLAFFEFYG